VFLDDYLYFCGQNNSFINSLKTINGMKSIGYIGAFLGGAIAGGVLGLLLAPETGSDTRKKITDTVEDFLKKHDIKLSRKDVGDLVDDIEDLAD